MFAIDPTTSTVTYDGAPVPFEVFAVREIEAHRGTPARHTFVTTIADRLHVHLSWRAEPSPAEAAGGGQRVWWEASYVLGDNVFFLDRPGAWTTYAGLTHSPGERPCKYAPQLQTAAAVYEMICTAARR